MKRYVYLLSAGDYYKIGVGRNVEKRIKQLQTGCSDEIVLVSKFLSDFPFKIESVLHNRYKDDLVMGEWYDLSESAINNFLSDCQMLEDNFIYLAKSQNPYFVS